MKRRPLLKSTIAASALLLSGLFPFTVLHQGRVLGEGSLEQVQADERVIEVYLGR